LFTLTVTTGHPASPASERCSTTRWFNTALFDDPDLDGNGTRCVGVDLSVL
jgi:hypothetical protein